MSEQIDLDKLRDEVEKEIERMSKIEKKYGCKEDSLIFKQDDEITDLKATLKTTREYVSHLYNCQDKRLECQCENGKYYTILSDIDRVIK